MSNAPRQLTRNQLAEFLPNARAVRAFEQLLKYVGDLLPNDVATLTRLINEANLAAGLADAKAQSAADALPQMVQDAAINAGQADAKAAQALAALQAIQHLLQLIATSPARRDDNSVVTDYIDMRDNGWLPAFKTGRVWFGPTGTLEVAMGNGNITQQVGEEFFRYGKASSAISDTNLQLVYKTGVVGASGVIKFAPAVAGITDPDQILGVATEPIALNAFGRITTMGVVHGVNTTGSVYGETWTDNDDIWYNPVTGGLTKTKPSAPNIKLQIGTVINAGSGGSGSFSVKIGSSSSLGGTDSNVQFGTLASGNIIIYDAVAQYFKNAFLTAGANVTITNGPGSISIAVSGAPPIGAAGGVLSGTYPNPGFAVDMATQAELDAHTGATGTSVHGLKTSATLDFDTDGALTANSNTLIPTQKAVKTYVDTAVTGLLDFKGNIDCSTNPNYPAALKGDAYAVSGAGKIGGASGVAVDVGDVIVASADNAGGTQAAVGSSWFILEHNLQGALLAANNLSDLVNKATARTNLGVAIGTDVEAAITAGTTAQYWRGDKTWRDFATDVRATILTGLSTATNAVITATDTVLSALGKLQKQISDNLTTLTSHTGNTSNPHSTTAAQVGAEPTITAGTTAQYWRGDKTWQTHNAASVGLGNVTNDAQLKIASNLSDLNNAATARTNLGLGSMATQNSSAVSISGGSATLLNATTTIHYGKNYGKTSTSGTIAITDTGITRTAADVGFDYGSVYELHVTGSQNAGGNVTRNTVTGIITVCTGIVAGNFQVQIFYQDLAHPTTTGITNFTVSAVFWNGTSEVANILTTDTTSQIRIKVDGYNASYAGYDQVLRLTKRL